MWTYSSGNILNNDEFPYPEILFYQYFLHSGVIAHFTLPINYTLLLVFSFYILYCVYRDSQSFPGLKPFKILVKRLAANFIKHGVQVTTLSMKLNKLTCALCPVGTKILVEITKIHVQVP